MTSSSLLVPVTLRAFVINQSSSNQAKNAPSAAGNELSAAENNTPNWAIRRWKNNYYNLKDFTSPETPAFSGETKLGDQDNGVYLHWELPSGLRHGQEQSKTDKTIRFPEVPNRWLVVRVVGNNNSSAWVIDSDYIGAEGGASFPNLAEPDKRILIGRKTPLAEWSEPLAQNSAACLDSLTAVANGDVSFSIYQPYHPNVFSMFDDCQGVQNKNDISYWVLGWYANLNKDPLSILKGNINPAILSSEQVAKLAKDYFWQFKDDQKIQLSRTLFHGLSVKVDLDRTAKPELNSENLKVSIANTAMDALETLVKEADLPLLENLANDKLVQCLQKLNQSDGDEEIEHQQHQAGFAQVSSGVQWKVLAKQRDLKPEVPSQQSPAEAALAGQDLLSVLQGISIKSQNDGPEIFEELNRTQRDLNYAERVLQSWQWQLYALWWKRGHAKANEFASADFFKPLLEGLEIALADSHQAKSFMRQIKRQQKAVADLKVSVQNLYQGLNQALGAVQKPGYELKRVANEPFYRPQDPLILLQGLGSTGLAKLPRDLNCRLESQLLGSGQGSSFGQEKLPDFLKENNLISLLEQENLQLIDIVKGLSLAEKGDLPDFSLALWKQPWEPLFLEWELEWAPLALSDFEFQGDTGLYQLNKGKSIEQSALQTFKGRTLLTPQAGFAFKRKLETALSQDLTLVLSEAEASTYQSLKSKASLSPGESEQLKGLEDKLQNIIAQIEQLDLLSQRLSGFHSQLVLRDGRMQRKPSAQHEALYEQAVGQEIRQAPIPGAIPMYAAEPSSRFQPLRQGQFLLKKLVVVDSFGQALEFVDLDNGLGSNLVPSVSDDLKPSPEEEVKIDRGAEPAERQAYQVQLAPRVVQPMRLTVDWLSPLKDSDNLNLHPEINPVCAWILPNYLDAALQVFDAEGQYLGELRKEPEELSWDPTRSSVTPSLSDLSSDKRYPQLCQFLLGLKDKDKDKDKDLDPYEDLLNVIEAAFEQKTPASTQSLQYFSALVGRPLALIRSQWQFEFKEACYQDQSWHHTAELLNPLTSVYEHQGDRLFKAKTSDKRYLNQAFSLRLGNQALSQEGLIGYFQGNDYQKFYTGYQPKSGSSYYCQAFTDQEFRLSLARESRAFITLLADVAFPVRVYSDVLPVKLLRLDKTFVDIAWKNMILQFRLGPILIEQPFDVTTPQGSTPEGVKKPAKTVSLVQMPKPGLGEWSWVQPKLDAAKVFDSVSLRDIDTQAHLNHQAYYLAEGFLSTALAAAESPGASSSSQQRVQPLAASTHRVSERMRQFTPLAALFRQRGFETPEAALRTRAGFGFKN